MTTSNDQWLEDFRKREARLEASHVERTSKTQHFNLTIPGRKGKWTILNTANEIINVLEENRDILNALYNHWLANEGSMMVAESEIPKRLLKRFNALTREAQGPHSGSSWAFAMKAAMFRILGYVDIMNYMTPEGKKWWNGYVREMAIAEDRRQAHERKLALKARERIWAS